MWKCERNGAAAVVEIMGGSAGQCANACAMAIKNQLGLVCDPVAGLVEIPCIKRNVSGVVIAFSAAEMALAGIESKIPADECIDAMRDIGSSMPCALKETARGGLAATPTGERLREQVFGKSHSLDVAVIFHQTYVHKKYWEGSASQ